MFEKPLAFKIKGDFGTVYITKDGIKDVATYITKDEVLPYVSNIHPDDDIIDRDSFKYNNIIIPLYELLDHKYKSDGHLDNIDVTVNRDYQEKYWINVKIFHGDIEISNSLYHKAILKKLYTKTRLYADEKGLKFRELFLFRTEINSVEANKMFIHPHSPGIRVESPRWSPMCLGDSELYKHFFRNKRKYSDMALYCLYLDAYLAWESKEGGPYSTIESVYDCENNKANKIEDIDVESVIYDNADIFKVVESSGHITVSSDFINDIEIEGVTKTNSLNNYLNVDMLKLKRTDYSNDVIKGQHVFFKGENLTLSVKDIDTEKLMPYLVTVYNTIPKRTLSQIKRRLSSIINFNYANNEETIRSTGATTEG